MFQCSLVLLCLMFTVNSAIAKKLTEANVENCEVCVKFLGRFIDQLDSDSDVDRGSVKVVEKEFMKFCKHAKKDDNRFCYYIGGTDDAATSTLGAMSKPVSWGVPADKICMKLYRLDEQICDLKYDKEIDLSAVDFKKLKVKDLKNILSGWEEQCRGCTEKSDFIRRIEELMPIHAPDSAAKREEL